MPVQLCQSSLHKVLQQNLRAIALTIALLMGMKYRLFVENLMEQGF